MQFYVYACLFFTVFCVSLSDGNPVRVKRTAHLNIGDKHGLTFDDKNPDFMNKMESMLPNFGYSKRSIRSGHVRPKRSPGDDEGYESESYFPTGFYPYKNVGSLYVDGKNVKINKPMYNYGVDSYGYPPYGYAVPYSSSEETEYSGVTT